MKILAINASHRGDRGYTRFLIDRLFEGACEAGAECEVVTLAGLKIKRCLACGICQQSATFHRCVHAGQDDVAGIFAKMAAAGLIVYATPVYIFNMSGLLKTFLDRLYSTGDSQELRATDSGRLFHDVDPAICSKPFLPLVCCDNIEADTPKNVISYFRTFSKFMDAPLAGMLVRNAGVLTGQGHDPALEERFPRIKAAHAAFIQAGRELALAGRVKRATQRRANQDVLPVPLFSLIKRIPLKPLKEIFVERARLW